MIATVLLDVDGTLVASNGAHASAWSDAFAEAGVSRSREAILPLIGLGGKDMLRRAADLGDETEPGKTIARRRKEIFAERYAATLRPTPGARDLLLYLRERGVACVVASAAQPEELERLLDAAGVADLIDDSSTSGDADAGKPAPDILTAALKKAGTDAADAVMLGDTPYDVEAAGRVPMRAIGLLCGGWSASELAPAAVFADPGDLLARIAESPLREIEEGRKTSR